MLYFKVVTFYVNLMCIEIEYVVVYIDLLGLRPS